MKVRFCISPSSTEPSFTLVSTRLGLNLRPLIWKAPIMPYVRTKRRYTVGGGEGLASNKRDGMGI